MNNSDATGFDMTVHCSRRQQSTVNSQHHSGVTGNDITHEGCTVITGTKYAMRTDVICERLEGE